MNSPHKNVDFSDGQKNPLWIHSASTVIPLTSQARPDWSKLHHCKLPNISAVSLKRPFIQLTICYIFSIKDSKIQIFYRIGLHL